MTLFESFTKNGTIHYDYRTIMVVYNAFRQLAQDLQREAAYDLYDDDDAMRWIKRYGITIYRKCIAKARYWVGGDDYSELSMFCINEDNADNLLRNTCDGCEEYIKTHCTMGYPLDVLIERCNKIFPAKMHIAEWCHESIKAIVCKYGKDWVIYPKSVQPNTKWKNNPEGDEDWFVVRVPTGNLWMNNKYGYMMITEDNQTLYCDI